MIVSAIPSSRVESLKEEGEEGEDNAGDKCTALTDLHAAWHAGG
eukprot:CAMPEP_0198448380 /NCGR_PEP_ID=MMETSP1453-20131121/3367_1 /TAXON_ID=1461543 ORGANISM="Unidentified sp., Strain RCC701" /NCGR_SAMPLE_ID=MMETSP1453 /ASSEMBLY_ACC=CAM_ASM_001118 /LENGTH=43 /DNA_ID= /DNA_START= /DNA_END= /DNA_ORIENTATION=